MRVHGQIGRCLRQATTVLSGHRSTEHSDSISIRTGAKRKASPKNEEGHRMNRQGGRRECSRCLNSSEETLREKSAGYSLPSKAKSLGGLGGSTGWASDFGSGHDLAVCGFEPQLGLCADSSEPGACFGFCVSLSASPLLVLCVSLSVSKINIKKNYPLYPHFTDEEIEAGRLMWPWRSWDAFWLCLTLKSRRKRHITKHLESRGSLF